MSRMMLESEADQGEVLPSMAKEASEESSSPRESRKRIYNGSAGLVVEDPETVRRDLEKAAHEAGGYAEESYADYLVLRVPAADFEDFFAALLTKGRVEYRQIETWDVTDQYRDTQGRLTTARETRRRLYALLEKSRDAEERAKILREIGRLSEEIAGIEQQLLMLDSRVAFSRITVELIPLLAEGAYRDEIPFDWIARLSPLSPVSSRLDAYVELQPGEEFALFDREEIFLAEDAAGRSISVSSLPNAPRGDAAFWQKALLHHLGGYYAEAEPLTLAFGDKQMQAVVFTSKDREPYRYFVGVVAEKRSIHVAEIFSPRGEDLSPFYESFAQGECR